MLLRASMLKLGDGLLIRQSARTPRAEDLAPFSLPTKRRVRPDIAHATTSGLRSDHARHAPAR